MDQLNRLTALEIAIQHGACAQPKCAICNERPLSEIAAQLQKWGFQVESLSEDCKMRFGYVEVREGVEDCLRLLRRAFSAFALAFSVI